jgi:hypothetical protein
MTSTSASETQDMPTAQCDVVMKGGITSGVVYPEALGEIGASYRFRGVGGASAGAIGAAIGAAAELGRSSGGFARMAALPSQLGNGRLATLFQPQPSTQQLLRLMLTATGNDRPGAHRSGLGKYAALTTAMLAAFPFASLGGLAPGIAGSGTGRCCPACLPGSPRTPADAKPSTSTPCHPRVTASPPGAGSSR